MPVFREFWGWAAFAVLALASLLIAALETEWNGYGDYALEIGRKVQPMWVTAAILVYTVMEGIVMLADAYKRKSEAKGAEKMQAAVVDVARRRGADLEEIQSIVDEARKVVRNGNGA